LKTTWRSHLNAIERMEHTGAGSKPNMGEKGGRRMSRDEGKLLGGEEDLKVASALASHQTAARPNKSIRNGALPEEKEGTRSQKKTELPHQAGKGRENITGGKIGSKTTTKEV